MQAFANSWGLTLMFDKYDRVKFFSPSHGGEWRKREEAAVLSCAPPPEGVRMLPQ